jgi:phosphoribosylaminoimidazolecarboxamide formyltransferase/IMP cyclohydrolase
MPNRKLALLSVSDKTGIEFLGRGLADLGFEILSTGGTAKALASAGIPITKVSDYTGFPEIMDGRVKTLHPKIHGGILARDIADHKAELKKIGGRLVSLVAVNLYPFERTASIPSSTLFDLVEQTDVGGPCMLRAAAKNFERVTVICDPKDYENLLWHLARSAEAPLDLRYELALKAFAHTAAYDAAIVRTLSEYDVHTGKRMGGPK